MRSATRGTPLSKSTLWRRKQAAQLQRRLASLDMTPQEELVPPQPMHNHDGSEPEIALSPDPVSTVEDILDAPSDVSFALLRDLDHLSEGLLVGSLTLALSETPLVFQQPPDLSQNFIRYDPESDDHYNSGPFALDSSKLENQQFLNYYMWLVNSFRFLAMPLATSTESLDQYRTSLMSRVRDEISRLEDMKEIEWEARQISASPTVTGVSKCTIVDTSE